MNMIPFGKPIITKSDFKEVKKVLNSGILTHGPVGGKFENEFSKYTGLNNCLSVSSCTAALFLAYKIIGLKKGDEFIVPSQTHISAVHAGIVLGAKPIFVDSNLEDGNIQIDRIIDRISKKTKAITIVHYLGKPLDIKKLIKLKKKFNFKIIEDCALSLGAKYYGKHVGNYSDFACFSFYPAKHITTGDGGMLFCKNKSDFKSAKLFRGFGVDKNFFERKIPGIYDVNSLGLNFRMSDINAAIGRVQLLRLNKYLKKRESNFFKIYNGIRKIKKIKILNNLSDKNFKSSYYCLTFLINKGGRKKRNTILKKLVKVGVGCSVHYPKAVPEYSYFKNNFRVNKMYMKNASIISNNSVCLPVGPHLNNVEIKKIVYEINNIFK